MKGRNSFPHSRWCLPLGGSSLSWLVLLVALNLPPLTWGQMTPEIAKSLLRKHNEYRGIESSSDMYQLHWNVSLQRRADGWIQRCIFDHEYNLDLGENLYFDTNHEKDVLLRGLEAWHKEKSNWGYSNTHCNTACHFTQLVWAYTTSVGCSTHVCPMIRTPTGSFPNAMYLACYYYPRGNAIGSFPFKRGRRCSECAEGDTCANGLCVSSTQESKTAPEILKLFLPQKPSYPHRPIRRLAEYQALEQKLPHKSPSHVSRQRHYQYRFRYQYSGPKGSNRVVSQSRPQMGVKTISTRPQALPQPARLQQTRAPPRPQLKRRQRQQLHPTPSPPSQQQQQQQQKQQQQQQQHQQRQQRPQQLKQHQRHRQQRPSQPVENKRMGETGRDDNRNRNSYLLRQRQQSNRRYSNRNVDDSRSQRPHRVSSSHQSSRHSRIDPVRPHDRHRLSSRSHDIEAYRYREQPRHHGRRRGSVTPRPPYPVTARPMPIRNHSNVYSTLPPPPTTTTTTTAPAATPSTSTSSTTTTTTTGSPKHSGRSKGMSTSDISSDRKRTRHDKSRLNTDADTIYSEMSRKSRLPVTAPSRHNQRLDQGSVNRSHKQAEGDGGIYTLVRVGSNPEVSRSVDSPPANYVLGRQTVVQEGPRRQSHTDQKASEGNTDNNSVATIRPGISAATTTPAAVTSDSMKRVPSVEESVGGRDKNETSGRRRRRRKKKRSKNPADNEVVQRRKEERRERKRLQRQAERAWRRHMRRLERRRQKIVVRERRRREKLAMREMKRVERLRRRERKRKATCGDKVAGCRQRYATCSTSLLVKYYCPLTCGLCQPKILNPDANNRSISNRRNNNYINNNNNNNRESNYDINLTVRRADRYQATRPGTRSQPDGQSVGRARPQDPQPYTHRGRHRSDDRDTRRTNEVTSPRRPSVPARQGACQDDPRYAMGCVHWANTGHCHKNKLIKLVFCKRTCRTCT